MKSIKHSKKSLKEERLPSRFARAELTGGDMVQRSMNNYAKKTPSGPNANSPSFLMMSMMGPRIR
jgi:hypothetical protein